MHKSLPKMPETLATGTILIMHECFLDAFLIAL
jgi:hypothetical protein